MNMNNFSETSYRTSLQDNLHNLSMQFSIGNRPPRLCLPSFFGPAPFDKDRAEKTIMKFQSFVVFPR